MRGKIVRTRRRRLGLTQAELARRTQLSVRSIRDIETGRTATPRPRTTRLLADALGVEGADREHLLAPTSYEPIDQQPSTPRGQHTAQLPPGKTVNGEAGSIRGARSSNIPNLTMTLSVTVDNELGRALDQVVAGGNRSAVVAQAIREYLDRRHIAAAAAWHASLTGDDAATLASFDAAW